MSSQRNQESCKDHILAVLGDALNILGGEGRWLRRPQGLEAPGSSFFWKAAAPKDAAKGSFRQQMRRRQSTGLKAAGALLSSPAASLKAIRRAGSLIVQSAQALLRERPVQFFQAPPALASVRKWPPGQPPRQTGRRKTALRRIVSGKRLKSFLGKRRTTNQRKGITDDQQI